MKKILVIITALVLFVTASLCFSCTSNSAVGKYYSPNGNTPCPATLTIENYNAMIDAAVNSNNSQTTAMMMAGKILLLDVTKSYKIVGQGKNWYRISVDEKELYVSPNMGKVK